MKKKICFVTGTRAEYGLMRLVMQGIKDDPSLTLQVIATGAHLSPEFGLTYREIESDGFLLDRKVEILTSSDTPVGIAKSMGLALIGFADALNDLKPDLIVVLGDRFEILAVAQVAMVLQIPVTHLAGGDNGHGTYDNIIRHCITKMASIHFVTHDDARRRVIQLGESPSRVFCYGATSVENAINTPLLSRDALARKLGIKLKRFIFLVTYHPLTMDEFTSEAHLIELLEAIDELLAEKKCSVVFTKANADNGGRLINQILCEYIETRPNCYLFDSLGQTCYLSMMKAASVVIGNSSSGIYEAPYLKTPTVDIGSRQRGRAAPASVIRCEPNRIAILGAIREALCFEFQNVEMIYGDGDTSVKVVKKIRELVETPLLAVKTFHDIEVVL